MKIRPGLMIVLLSTLPFSNVYAEKPEIAINCQQWLDVRQEKAEQATMYWLQGFVAAYNTYEYRGNHPKGVFKTDDTKVIAKWLDDHCQNKPESNPQEAVESLIEEKKPYEKACPIRKSSGRPCIPSKEEKEKTEEATESSEQKNKWLPWF